MNRDEALVEARRRWGLDAWVGSGGLLPYAVGIDGVLGAGKSWEECFEDADHRRSMNTPGWSRIVPTVAVVQARQHAEGQPVRFWLRHTKPDGHGNERYVVEMRVMDDKLFWLIPDENRFERWTEAVLDDKYDDAEWAWCVPPDVAR